MIRPTTGIYKCNLSTLARPLKQMVVLMLALAAMISLAGAVPGHASDRAFDEYQVKAVFLYRLTLFVTWPEDAFQTVDEPFVIGILGEDPFGVHIDRVIKNENFKKRPVVARRYHSVEEVLKAPSQVLFINKALKQRWRQLKQKLAMHPTLTVSDMEEFGQLGGMINIKTKVNKIKIEINPEETQKTGLKISSKLLKVSRNVATADKGGLR